MIWVKTVFKNISKTYLHFDNGVSKGVFKVRDKTLLKGLEINIVSCTSLTITVCTTLSHVTQTISDTVIWNYWNNGHHRPTAVAVNSNVYNATCN